MSQYHVAGAPGAATTESERFNWLERRNDDFPYYRGRPVEITVSDIPTLALAGMLDVQTDPSAAERVAATLSNSQWFLFPETGHGAILFNQCAEDIAQAFINDPTRELSGDCVDDLAPQFATK